MTSTAAGDRVLEISHLTTHYVSAGGRRVVRAVEDVSLAVRAGQTLGIVGESGSGKSTLAMAITRLMPRAARTVGGQIHFEGEDLLGKSAAAMQRIRGKRIAMILQDPMTSLNPLFRIGDQIGEPLRFHERLGRRSAWARAGELLRAVCIAEPDVRLREYPHQMSGGMRQRVVGAIAMACAPRLLIADEPTTSLDVTIQAQYLNLLRDLQRQHGLAMIFITHNLRIVAKMCDDVAVMYAGRVVEHGPVQRIFDAPAHPYTRALIQSIPGLGGAGTRLSAIDGQPPDLAALPEGCAFAPRCRDAMPRCREEVPPHLDVQGGHTVSCWLWASAGAPTVGARIDLRASVDVVRSDSDGEAPTIEPSAEHAARIAPLIEARGLEKHFAMKRGLLRRSRHVVRAVDGVSFTIRTGETLGLVGESGCGKTTTANMLLWLERPTGGSVWFDGQELRGHDANRLRQYRRSVQAVFQDPYASLNPRMRVGAIVGEPLVANERLASGDVARRVGEVLECVGLPARVADLYPYEFSGGQRQRIAIARALALSPKLLVLDEPVSALDLSIRAQILNLLGDLQRRLRLSYLFITHDLAAVAHISHRIAVMYLGQIVEIGDAATLARAPRHPYTQALFAAALPFYPAGTRDDLVVSGEVASPLNPPAGCRFHPRCPFATSRCAQEAPALRPVEGELSVACHLVT